MIMLSTNGVCACTQLCILRVVCKMVYANAVCVYTHLFVCVHTFACVCVRPCMCVYGAAKPLKEGFQELFDVYLGNALLEGFSSLTARRMCGGIAMPAG